MYNQRSSYSHQTILGIDEKFERVLCYLGLWVTGIIFLVIENRNPTVRRHAYQSLVVFGTLSIAALVLGLLGGALGWIFVLGWIITLLTGILGWVVGAVTLIAWIGLMVLAYISPETFIGNHRRDLM